MCRLHDLQQSRPPILHRSLLAALRMDPFHPVGRHTEPGQCYAGPRAGNRAGLFPSSQPKLPGALKIPLYVNTSISIASPEGTKTSRFGVGSKFTAMKQHDLPFATTFP